MKKLLLLLLLSLPAAAAPPSRLLKKPLQTTADSYTTSDYLLLNAPKEPISRLKEFMRDMVDKKLSNNEIGDKYFCTAVLHRTDHYGEEARGYLEFSLSHQRDSLRTQKVNLSEVRFTAYDALPASEIPSKPFHMLSETTHVYVAQYQGRIILFMLFQDDKIASTLLLGQGDEHYFIDLCN